MERLTNKREADAQRKDYENRIYNGYPRNIPEERFLRLADYEDTGLTPAEVRSMHGEWQAMMSVLNSIGGYDRLRELAEAVKDRRVWVLPCKVGDTVYSVSQVLVGVRPYIVDRVIEPYFRVKDVENGTLAGGFYLQEFGRTVFLAREEAEKALEEAKHGHE